MLVVLPLLGLVLYGAWLLSDFALIDPTPVVAKSRSAESTAAGIAGNTLADWTYEKVTEWPAKPDDNVLYVGYNEGEAEPVAAQLQCPCGCGLRMRISLREQDDPHWFFSDVNGRPTLTPRCGGTTAANRTSSSAPGAPFGSRHNLQDSLRC